MQRQPGECIGGGDGAAPLRGTVQSESGDRKSGECAGCGQRLTLDHNGGIPRHQLPDRGETKPKK